MRTKPSHALSMRDRLSHLTFDEARKMLGPRGRALLLEGGQLEPESLQDITIDERQARLRWGTRGPVCRTVFDPHARGGWRVECLS